MIPETTEFLKQLISLPGLTGHEGPVRAIIERAWSPLTDALSVSRLGSLHGLRRGALPEPRPSLLYAVHMDAIGLMVSGVVDGFLRVTGIGGLDRRVLPGQMVTVHGREDLPGVIAQPADHLLPSGAGDKTVALEHLLVDTGLPARQVARLARVGDLVSFAQPPFSMGEDYLAGHSLDNRASVAALTCCLQELHARQLAWDVWAVATVQEEETLAGAYTSAFQLRPTLAVAVDVTYGASPGAPAHKSYALGKGPTLGWGANIHPRLYEAFKSLAEKLEIPTQQEIMPISSGTDAIGMQVTAEGIPSMVVSIPLRYMHTPVEMVAVKDIERAGRLLAEFAVQLDENFMQGMSLE